MQYGTYSTYLTDIRIDAQDQIPPGQSAEREAFKADTNKKEANAIKDAVKGNQEDARDAVQLGEAVEVETIDHKTRVVISGGCFTSALSLIHARSGIELHSVLERGISIMFNVS